MIRWASRHRATSASQQRAVEIEELVQRLRNLLANAHEVAVWGAHNVTYALDLRG